ncbi:MAG: hypothetical protein JSS66_15770 [Armatimonadetes bacterium]|nr:hypothetical protein [Armatimonadota bacterium]
MDDHCPSQAQALEELQRLAPEAPFLSLGQTVFWDEPMKAGVALRSRNLGFSRAFVAGVHDTDYFAKAHQKGRTVGYGALPHNDLSTKGLWSAAGEFSALFGSETVVSRESLIAAGAKLAKVQSERPGYLEEVTEAWGWRGVVSFGPDSQITAEKPLGAIFRPLYETFDWAVTTSLELIAGPHRQEAEVMADQLREMLCDGVDGHETETLSSFYERLIPSLVRTVCGQDVEMRTTATTDLLKFNTQTCDLPRFDLFRLFVDPSSRAAACEAYNQALRGSEMYTLDRFGPGSLPFDLYIPGVGRGTLRLGSRGGVVMAPEPVGFSYKKAPQNLRELASLIETRFGQDCVLVGKAVTLIGMLAREFVFVFHEGASSYVTRSRQLHQNLASAGHQLEVNPILRVGYRPWDALNECCAWFRLPEPFKRPFGVDELSGCSFAARWREVVAQQKDLLGQLAQLRRPLELIRFLDTTVGGQWNCLASRFESLNDEMTELNNKVAEVKVRKADVAAKMRAAKAERVELEVEKGVHWRTRLFEKNPTESDWAERARLTAQVQEAIGRFREAKTAWAELQAEQDAIVNSEQAQRARDQRRRMSFEAELTRVRLIREAVTTSEGLAKAGHRPAAWWFPLVCPDHTWFNATMATAQYRLEPLI